MPMPKHPATIDSMSTLPQRSSLQKFQKVISGFLMLTAAALLLTGFSWGSFGFSGNACKEALDAAGKLENISDASQRRQAEDDILSKCPDGAAANFVAAQRLERVGNLEGAISEYRKAQLKDRAFRPPAGIWDYCIPKKR